MNTIKFIEIQYPELDSHDEIVFNNNRFQITGDIAHRIAMSEDQKLTRELGRVPTPEELFEVLSHYHNGYIKAELN